MSSVTLVSRRRTDRVAAAGARRRVDFSMLMLRARSCTLPGTYPRLGLIRSTDRDSPIFRSAWRLRPVAEQQEAGSWQAASIRARKVRSCCWCGSRLATFCARHWAHILRNLRGGRLPHSLHLLGSARCFFAHRILRMRHRWHVLPISTTPRQDGVEH